MAVSLGDAVVNVSADMAGFEDDVETGVDDAMSDVEKKTGDTGKKSGSKMGAALGAGLKRATLAVGGAAVAGIGYSLVKGMQRLTAIDDATAKLRGLGNSAGDVEKIMDNALAAVKGTAFGMGEAATTAAGAVAAGIKPGKELTKYLTLVGDAATIAGIGMDEMGSIFNKVSATGKLTGDVMAQLLDRGIPILSLLADQLGVTEAKVAEMVSDGKVKFDDFAAAMQAGMGGAAQDAGKTFTGALANLKAAIGRIGANFLEPFFSAAIGSMAAFTDLLAPVEDFATRAGTALKGLFDLFATGDFTKGLHDSLGWFEDSPIVGAILNLRDAFVGLKDSAVGLVQAVAPGLGDLGSNIVPTLTTAFELVLPAVTGMVKALSWLLDLVAENADLLPILAVAVAGVTLAMKANTIILQTQVAWYKIWVGVSKVATIASQVFSLGLRGIGKAMYAALGPVGLIIGAITLLVTAFTIAYKRSETFRRIVDKAWAGIKKGALAVVKWFQDDFLGFFTDTIPNAFRAVVDWVKINWPKLVALLTGPIGAAIMVLTGHGDQIKELFSDIAAGARAALGKLGDWAGGLWQGISDKAHSALGGLGDWVGGVWQKVTDKVPILETARTKVADAFSGITDHVTDWASKVGGVMTGLFDLIVKGDFTPALNKAFGWFEDNPVIGLILGFRQTVVDAFGDIKDAFSKLFSGDLSGAVSGFRDVFSNAISGINDTIKTGVPELIERGSELIGALIEGAKSKVTDLIAWVTGLPERIHTAASGLATTLTDRGEDLVQSILDGAKHKVDELVAWLIGLPGRIKEKVTSWAAYLSTHGGELIQGILDGAKQKATELAEWVRGLPGRIKEWLPNAGAWLKSHGTQIIKGLVKGLKVAIPILLGVVIGLPVLIAAAIVGAAGLLVYAGVTLIVELAKGIGKAIGERLQPVFSRLNKWIRTKFAEGWSKVTGIITKPITQAGQRVAQAWSNIRNRFSQARKWVGSTWRDSWSKVGGWISGTVANGRDKVRNLWGNIQDRFTNARKWVGSTWLTGWSKVSGWISNAVGRGRDRTGDFLAGIRKRFSDLREWAGSSFRSGWGHIENWLKHPIESAKNAIRRLMSNESFQKIFLSVVNTIDRVWKKLESIMAKPVNWVIKHVLNPLINAIKNVGKPFNVAQGLKTLDPIGGYETGGVIPGYTPGRDTHLIAAGGGEAIMRPEFTRAVGEPWVHAANAAARAGGISGAKQFLSGQRYGAFASGGVFQPVPGRGNRHTSGYGWATWAGDYPVPTDTPVKAWKDGIVAAVKYLTTSYGRHVRINHDDGSSSLYAHLNTIGVKVGQQVAAGMTIARSDSTGNSTGPHLHFETMGKPYNGGTGSGSSEATGLMNTLNTLKTLAKTSLPEQFGDTVWTDLLMAVPKKIGTAAFDFLKDKVGSLMDSAQGYLSDAVGWVGGKLSGLSGEQKNNAGTIIDVAKKLGFGDRGAIIGLITALVESGLRNLSWGDRDSVGLFQQRAAWGSFADRTNPATSASMFFLGGQGGQPGLRDKAWRSGGYGGLAQAVQVSAFPSRYSLQVPRAKLILAAFKRGKYDDGGWLPPGLSLSYNGTGRQENKAVFTAQQWQTLSDIATQRDTGPGMRPGDRLIIEVEGQPITARVKKVVADESRRALTRI